MDESMGLHGGVGDMETKLLSMWGICMPDDTDALRLGGNVWTAIVPVSIREIRHG
jgi:hypothetical protein